MACPATKGQCGKGQSGKGQSAKGQSAKGQSGKDQSGKDQCGKDQCGKGQCGKDQSRPPYSNRPNRTAVCPRLGRRLGITSRQSSCGVLISVSPSMAISVSRRAMTSPPW